MFSLNCPNCLTTIRNLLEIIILSNVTYTLIPNCSLSCFPATQTHCIASDQPMDIPVLGKKFTLSSVPETWCNISSQHKRSYTKQDTAFWIAELLFKNMSQDFWGSKKMCSYKAQWKQKFGVDSSCLQALETRGRQTWWQRLFTPQHYATQICRIGIKHLFLVPFNISFSLLISFHTNLPIPFSVFILHFYMCKAFIFIKIFRINFWINSYLIVKNRMK